jgi:hypothetical protein
MAFEVAPLGTRNSTGSASAATGASACESE